ncbi:type VI secretion system-associated FHA domain protein TagH [Pseudomonas sp. H9]|uniref:type VI secretion system-associated FHA domain protein TagH n=1 Tax=Pseudomonas sp. H9 TaxID=483968 RepID=UPI0010577E25|nr:type VI secretion system-associated FHA domain protein TagH [Pseudomonas sp. H9]TDF82463.1 type VI secretion system-associated FHA domain protein TagH [Pseudomonas sp. H9]
MELVFEMLNSWQFEPKLARSWSFTLEGGVIGRAEGCDWVIPDSTSQLSKCHAKVSYRDGAFFLTDTSSNGTWLSNGARLYKGTPHRIEHGSVYRLGRFEIRALLVRTSATPEVEAGRPQAAGSTIPDDAFIGLDPLKMLDEQERMYAPIDELAALDPPRQATQQRADFARIDVESLLVPELVAPPEAPVAAEQAPVADTREDFWRQFAAALGVELTDLDQDEREALAINAAGLLKHSIGGLQQSLYTRDELKGELRLALCSAQGVSKNPLKLALDTHEVLGILLQRSQPGQPSGEQAIQGALRELQAHQVALLAASRAALRGALEHFSPQQLTLRFERDSKPLLATAGSRWRAFGRYHQALREDDDWVERLLARDFAQAYEEQIRLIGTLHTDHQG